MTTRRRTGAGRLPKGDVLAAGPDGRVLAVSGDGGTRLWDTAADRWTGMPPAPDRYDVGVGPSGRSYLRGGTAPDGVQMRSVTDDRLLFETKDANRANVAPSTDDRRVAVCSDGKAPQVWDTTAHRTLPGA